MMMNFKMLMKALGTSCLVLACTVYSSHSAISAETAQPSKVVEKAGEVDLGALIQEWAGEMDHVYAETVIRNKDNSNKIFERLGIKDNTFKRYVNSIKPKENPFARLVPGRLIQARLTPKGEVIAIKLFKPIDTLSEDITYFQISRSNTGKSKFVHENKTSAFTTLPVAASAYVERTLDGAAQSAKIPAGVMKQVKEQLGDSFDVKKVANGDSFNVIYERRQLDGADLGPGRLLALEFFGKDKKVEAYWFENDNFKGYFNADGESVEKTFLRMPCEARLTSTFNRVRKHPVTGRLRPHWGIDLAAPTGTPIYASSDGKIVTKRYQRRGYGYWLEIDHGSGYSSIYAHMSKYAPGMKEGVQVKKGQLIGYVGRTGMVTGSHLHYELKHNGQQINPLTADLRTGEPLKGAVKQEFDLAISPIKRQLALLGKFHLAHNTNSSVSIE